MGVKPTVGRACDRCGAEYQARKDSLAIGHGRYCSRPCAFAGRRAGRVTLACAACGEAFEVPPYKAADPARGKYCSPACYHADREYDRRPLADRFWEKVRKGAEDECWPWTAAITTGGYGRISRGGREGKDEHAHRVAWELANGPIPDGLHALHRCDNRPCCNPAHLFLGTNRDNVDDKVAKGRQNRGETSPVATLTEERVTAMRRRYAAGGVTMKAAAREAGIPYTTAYKILTGERWKHLPREGE